MTQLFRFATPFAISDICGFLESGTSVTADGREFVLSESADALTPRTADWHDTKAKALADGADRMEALGFELLKRAYALRAGGRNG